MRRWYVYIYFFTVGRHLKITTIYSENNSSQKCLFIYLHNFQGASYDGEPILSPTETKTNNPMQSYRVARGEWKQNAQRRQQNTSRPREMPSDKIQRVLVYGKEQSDLSGLSRRSSKVRLEAKRQTNEALIHEEKKIRLTSEGPSWESLEQA